MKLRKQNQSEAPRFSPAELRTIFWFWFFWSAYLLLAGFLVTALITDWPAFLHDAPQFGR